MTTLPTKLRYTAAIPVALSLMAWALLVWSVANMSSPVVALMMPMNTSWSIQQGLAVWLMWSVMMVAMMLPSAIPVISAHRRLAAQRDPRTPDASLWFLSAYLLAWALFSVAAVVLQWGFQRADVLSHMLKLESGMIGGGILVAAGAFQLTPPKAACLHRCRTPAAFLLSNWRSGRSGAARMGLVHGQHCVVCCSGLMMLLFVGGVMSLTSIVVLTAIVAAEKLAPKGRDFAKLVGVVLVVWGLWQILAASGASWS